MKALFKTGVFVVLFLVFSPAVGQVIQLEMNIPTTRSLSKLQELEELARTNIHVRMTNLTDREQEFTIEAVMSSHETDFSILTNPDKGVVIRLGRQESRELLYNELLDLFSADQLVLGDASSTSLEQFLLNDPQGAIPAGNYQLCVRLRTVNIDQQSINSLSNTACSVLKFEHYSAPLLNMFNGYPCQTGCDFEDLPPSNAPLMVSFTTPSFNNVFGFNYRIKIFEATTTDFNQDFLAMQGSIGPNRYLYDQPVMSIPSGTTVFEALMPENIVGEFEKGKTYAIVIQASTLTGEPLPNDGYSQVAPFFFGGLMGEDEQPELANLPAECETGDCNNIPLPTGPGTEIDGLSRGDQVRFGCFWVTVKEATFSSGRYNGTGTVVLPFLQAKFLVKLVNAKIKKFDNLMVAIEGYAEGLPNAGIPTTGLVAGVTQAFNSVSPLVLDATGTMVGGAHMAAGAANSATAEVTNSLPFRILQSLYDIPDPGGRVDEAGQALVDGAITIDATANRVSESTGDFLQVLGKVDRSVQQVFNPSFETGLPIGYSDGEGVNQLRFGVFGMTFGPTRAAVNLVIQTPLIPAINNRLYFGGSNITISPYDFSLANTTFYLGGNLGIGIPGGHSMIIRGTGQDGESGRGTYLRLKNGEIDELMFNGEFVFSRSVFLPLDTSSRKVRALIQAQAIHDFDDVVLKITASEEFRLTANKGLKVKLDEMFLDLSSTQNPANWSALPAELKTGTIGQQNAWTGLMVSNASVTLPNDFKLGNDGPPPSIAFSYFMLPFDDGKVSFSAKASDVLTLSGPKKGTLAGFGFSISSIEMEIHRGEQKKFDMEGEIRTGIFDIVNATRGGGIPYKVDLLNLRNEDLENAEVPDFKFYLEIPKDVKMEISTLHTEFVISQGSYISYNSTGHDDDVLKKLQFELNGAMSVTATHEGLSLPSMTFQNFFFDGKDIRLDDFTIGFASPQKTFGGGFAPGTSASGTQAGGFPISLQGFYPVLAPEAGGVRLGFGFDIVLNLKEGTGFGLTTGIEVSTKIGADLEPVESSFSLDFKKIYIDTDISVSHVSGELKFIKNDPVFGNGFQGCIQVELKVPAPIFGQLQGMFGSIKNDSAEYRYFYVEGLLKGLNILIPQTPIAIDGFAGGLAYNMRKERNAPSFAARLNSEGRGCQPPALIPDPTVVGISLGVLVKEAASAGFSFNGMMSFEAEFNRETFAPRTFTVGGSMRFLKVPGPVPDNVAPGAISDPIKLAADLTLTYDFTQSVFYGNFNVYLDIAGSIKGKGEEGNAGRMAMYFGQDHWYIYLGNPWKHESDPGNILPGMDPYAAVTFTIPGTDTQLGEAGAYLCMGTYGINGLPADLPPLAFPDSLRSHIERYRNTAFNLGPSNGKGIAFGAYLGLNFDSKLGSEDNYFSISAGAGAGFDVVLTNYGNVKCGDDIIGINGYYAMGQIYGYANLSVDMTYDLLLGSGTRNLVNYQASLLLNFGAPNPTWLEGYVSISKSALSALGGLSFGWAITGVIETLEFIDVLDSKNKNIDFEIKEGTQCKPSTEDLNKIADREGSMSIVSVILPQNRENDKFMFSDTEPIRVILNKPLSETWEVTKYNSNGTTTTLRRKWHIQKAELKSGNQVIPLVQTEVSNREIAFYVRNPLPLRENQPVNFTLELVPYNMGTTLAQRGALLKYADGSSAVDQHRVSFTVKKGSAEITPQSIAFSYPVANQNYYLQGSSAQDSQGFVKLKYRNNTLLEANLVKTIKIFANNQPMGEVPFEYAQYPDLTTGAALKYSLPVLPNGKNIRLEFFVKKRQTETFTPNTLAHINTIQGNQPATTSNNEPVRIYIHNFKTSKYNNFEQKLASARNSNFICLARNSYLMSARIRTDEEFDTFEAGHESAGPGIRNFIRQSQVNLNTDWHTEAFRTIRQHLGSEWNFPQPYRNSSVSLSGGHLSVTLDANETLASQYTGSLRLPEPTAGTYSYTLYYEPPALSPEGILYNAGYQFNEGRSSTPVSVPANTTNAASGASVQSRVPAGATFSAGQNLNLDNTAPNANAPVYSRGTVNIGFTGYREFIATQMTAVQTYRNLR